MRDRSGRVCAGGLCGLAALRQALVSLVVAALSIVVGAADSPAGQEAVAIVFERDIRPIFADNCFACHGPDAAARQADLRFDTRSGATAELFSGGFAIVPGDATASKLLKRVSSDRDGFRMPPPETDKRLTERQIALLRSWIEQGAAWPRHWAFVAPTRPPVPEVRRRDWPRNAIDHFVLARLEREGRKPSAVASNATLIRRLSFDLNGLPPTLAEIDAFESDASPSAYEELVERLLASSRYGERMALEWLDAARYADTNGYHIDNERSMWPWRDWVIHAFNRNMPFDQFTIEQLAGDLLPDADLAQRIATGFNRNHMVNFEGGAIPEEYQTEYVIDRVNTTATVWMGLTFGCARCHDHKFDPISQKDFYSFYAFFNNVPEKGIDGQKGNAVPVIQVPTAEQAAELVDLREQAEQLETHLNGPMPEVDAAQVEWERETAGKLRDRWSVLEPLAPRSTGGATLTPLPDRSVFVHGKNPQKDTYEVVARTDAIGITAIRLEALSDERLPHQGAGRAENANFVLTGFELQAAPLGDPAESMSIELVAAHADFSQLKFPVDRAIDGDPKSGWAVDGHHRPEPRVAVFVPLRPIGFAGGTELRFRLKHESTFEQHTIGRFRLSVTTEVDIFRNKSPSRLGDWRVVGPFSSQTGAEAFGTEFEPEQKLAEGLDLTTTYRGGAFRWTPRRDFVDGKVHLLNGEISATYLARSIHAPTPRRMTLSLGSDDGIKVWVNGRLVFEKDVQRGVAPDQEHLTVELERGENHLLMKIVNYGGGYGFYFRVSREDGGIPLDVARILTTTASDKREEQPTRRVRDHYRGRHSPAWKKMSDELALVRRKHSEIDARVATTMVMSEMQEPRASHFLNRGQYDQRGDRVTTGLPAFLPPLPEDAKGDRLTLARWLVEPAHPLTARVVVNRLWQMLFGTGLVKTAEDFGTQGEWPSHPELLDWLAVEFVESGWDIRHMLRLIVDSATYRQTSRAGRERYADDPQNRLLARGPRFRLHAETIRDNALAIGGLLVEKLGGRSVKPYQPPGLWREVSYNPDKQEYTAQVYVQDKDESLYRRGLYTFWKRAVPPATLATFDAPNREICTVRRPRTNTPLQALALLSDPTFVEAARGLAQRMMTEAGPEIAGCVDFAFRLATARRPSAAERAALVDLYQDRRAAFGANEEEALKLLSVGEFPRNESLEAVELAAWTTVASVILNLDETITKN